MKSTSSLFKGKLVVTLAAFLTAAMLTASCGYSISDSAMEEGLVPDAVSQFYDNENRIIYTTASAEHRLPVKLDKFPSMSGPLLYLLKITGSTNTAVLTIAVRSVPLSATLWGRKYRVAVP